MPKRVSLITSVVTPGDAISICAMEKLIALRRCSEEFEVALYCYRCDDSSLGARVVGGVSELLCDPFFRQSEIVIYEFGIYYELFNSLFVLSPSALCLAHFHNVTPVEFVPFKMRTTIQRSFEQRANLLLCDEIFCDSELNRDQLVEYGVSSDRLTLLSPPLRLRVVQERVKDFTESFRVLFVGRFVPSKGVKELLAAFEKFALSWSGCSVELRLVGSQTFSDPQYMLDLRAAIKNSPLIDCIVLVGEVSDEELEREYHQAHLLVIPSYHEGFCVPVIEGYANGCGVLTFSSGNLPAIVGELGQRVPTGDVASLAEGIHRAASAFLRGSVQTANQVLDWEQFSFLSRLKSRPYQLENYHSRFLELIRNRITVTGQAYADRTPI